MLAQPSFQRTLLPGVRPDVLEARESRRHAAEDQLRPVAIRDVRRVDDDGERQAERVYEDAAQRAPALAPAELLRPVVAAWPPFSVVFTLWESMIPALGCTSLPAAQRTCSRSVSRARSHVPSRYQRRKYT